MAKRRVRFDRRESERQSTVASAEAHPAVAPPEEPVLQIPDPNDDIYFITSSRLFHNLCKHNDPLDNVLLFNSTSYLSILRSISFW